MPLHTFEKKKKASGCLNIYDSWVVVWIWQNNGTMNNSPLNAQLQQNTTQVHSLKVAYFAYQAIDITE